MAGPFDALLEAQEHDTRLDQIRHRMETLPERAEQAEAEAALATVERSLASDGEVRSELVRQQRRIEDEVETLGAKRSGVQATLYGGTVTNARELQDLQEEVEALGRRITQLEDQDLELMEQLEPVDARLAELEAARAAHVAALTDIGARVTVAEAELLVELDREEAGRREAAMGIPAELLREYESLRKASGGIGVARLVGSQCGGCHLTLSAMEVARIRKHAEEITHCEECGRLLVP